MQWQDILDIYISIFFFTKSKVKFSSWQSINSIDIANWSSLIFLRVSGIHLWLQGRTTTSIFKLSAVQRGYVFYVNKVKKSKLINYFSTSKHTLCTVQCLSLNRVQNNHRVIRHVVFCMELNHLFDVFFHRKQRHSVWDWQLNVRTHLKI